jgi:GTPase SAR1 family protein
MLKGFSLNLENKVIFNHHQNLPSPFRMLILGPSGSGKTTLALQMMLEPNFIDYNNLIIFTSNPEHKSEYQLLYHGYNNKLSKEDLLVMCLDQDNLRQLNQPISILCNIFSTLKEKDNNLNGDIKVSLSDKMDEIPLPEELNKKYGNRKHLIIFDDCARANKNMMEIYFTESRHSNCNCIYIAHDFFSLPKDVRINSNVIILFKQDSEKLSRIFNSTIGDQIMNKEKFIIQCKNTWTKSNSYVAINKTSEKVMIDIFE